MQQRAQEAAERIYATAVAESKESLAKLGEYLQIWLDQSVCLDEGACDFRRTIIVELMKCTAQELNPVVVGEALKRLIAARLSESVAA